jgi:hypothetical protein
MWRTIADAMAAKPEAGTMVMASLFSYAQVRCLYESGRYWEPEIADPAVLARASVALSAAPA